MSWLVAAVLGIVQGATEFLPVSSSGHLVIFSKLLNESDYCQPRAPQDYRR